MEGKKIIPAGELENVSGGQKVYNYYHNQVFCRECEARSLRVLAGKRNPMETAPLDMNSSVTDVDIHSLSTIVEAFPLVRRMKKKQKQLFRLQ